MLTCNYKDKLINLSSIINVHGLTLTILPCPGVWHFGGSQREIPN